MKIAIDISSLFFILGSLQGLIFSWYLFNSKHKARLSNKLMAWLMLVFSVNLLITELVKNFHDDVPHLISSGDPLLFLFGPLIYLYTGALTSRIEHLSAKDIIHFIPFGLSIAALIPFYIQNADWKLELYMDSFINGLPLPLVVGWMLACIQIAIYMYASLKNLNWYGKKIRQSFSNIEKINLQWLRYIVFGNLAVWVFDAFFFLAYILRIDVIGSLGYVSQMLSYLTAFLIYFIGYKALKQPEVFTVSLNQENGYSEHNDNRMKYNRSGLTLLKAEEYRVQLLTYMEEESPHLNPDLTLSYLSEVLSIPNNHLSQVINERFGKNFYDFTNSYRVKEAQAWLADPKRNSATMLEIALESGFKSKSTFNSAFKKHTSMTPSEYKNDHKTLVIKSA